ncbi:sugar phosphate isomerase/epimerase family protein [Treponema primitia]|uniref:sugar phosphate isomerase/epimerase family protein n=1 Tax=Treponema primitia TaxID=88058 RepID=UPI0002555041|nr:sugar phosphate isomerase/epimerase [Treponema primitia]
MKKGYQLYSAREVSKTRDGFISTLEKVASYGYDGVEFFDYADIPAAEIKKILSANHLDAINSHVSLDRWRNNLEQEIGYATEAGIPALTIPYILPEQRTEKNYRDLFRELPAYVGAAKKAGLKVCYHNHDFEYQTLDGQPILDAILSADNGLQLELDTFWTWFAGADPEAYLRKYAGRTPLIHIKDYLDRTKTPPVFCAIGEGKMENGNIVKTANSIGVEWIIVEQDNSLIDPLESARISIENIKKAGW